jgi:succinate-semialdehyde dehydrogenase/glutarate-semialdehyde dehydrogenase
MVSKLNLRAVITGGRRIDRPGFYLEPTILTNITPENPIYKEELFGPVASFYTVKDEAEAVRIANDTPYGLGALRIDGGYRAWTEGGGAD